MWKYGSTIFPPYVATSNVYERINQEFLQGQRWDGREAALPHLSRSQWAGWNYWDYPLTLIAVFIHTVKYEVDEIQILFFFIIIENIPHLQKQDLHVMLYVMIHMLREAII